MLGKKSLLLNRYGKLYVSPYIWHREHFCRQLDYNHVQEHFFIVFFTVLDRINRNKNKKFDKSFFVDLECQTRHNLHEI